MKKRGSAILLAILLITAVGAVAFSFGRMLYLQVAGASAIENGIGAYYAAESGIEEAFLRYRYSANSSIPETNWLMNPGNVFRYNLTDLSQISPTITDGIVKTSTATLNDSSKEFYDLRMGSIAGSTSKDENISLGSLPASYTDYLKDANYGIADSAYRIARDESRKIDLTNVFSDASSDIDLYFKPVSNDNVLPALSMPDCVLIEAKIIGTKSDGSVEERKALLMNDNSTTCPNYSTIVKDQSSVLGYTFSGDSDNSFSAYPIFEISALKSKLAPAAVYSQAILSLKPIGNAVAYLLNETGSNTANTPLLASTTSITSSGYYGGVVRTLSANLDRRSGALYDLFDYVIYKGN